MDSTLDVYCLPISGGGFVAQLGLLCEIYEAKKIANGNIVFGSKTYCPDLVFAASGGNVASYIALAGNWSTDGIIRCSQQIDPHSFTRKWVPNELSIIPNIVVGIFKSSLYNKGYGAGYLFKKLFTEKSISQTEIWTGTYNSDKKAAQFFCNKSQEESLVNESFFNEEQSMYDSLSLKFMNSNIELIAEVSIASASIPLIVPGQKIGNSMYADGGCSYSSPLSVFCNEIYRIANNDNIVKSSKYYFDQNNIYEKISTPWNHETTYSFDEKGNVNQICLTTQKKNLRLIYFMPYQENRINIKKENDFEKDIDAITQLLHISMLQDRNKMVDILRRFSSEIYYSCFPEMTTLKLGKLLQELSKYKYYALCLNPHNNPSVSLTHFTSQEILEKIHQTRSGYGVQIWYSKQLID